MMTDILLLIGFILGLTLLLPIGLYFIPKYITVNFNKKISLKLWNRQEFKMRDSGNQKDRTQQNQNPT